MTVVESTVASMYDLAVDLLDAVVAAMGTTIGGPPNRKFVSLGPPAWETSCAQAAVQVLGLTEEGTRDTSPAMQTGFRHARGRVNLVGLTAFAVRCIQASQDNSQNYMPASDAQLSVEARAAYEDGWAIWNHVTQLIKHDLLFSGPCGDVHFDGGVPLPPAGGLGGWQMTFRVELGGYVPFIDSGP